MSTSSDPETLAFSTLGPEQVLDAVESLGFRSNGRLLALNSYENRVYKVGLEDAEPLVAKFYRPGRWSDSAIEEEHRFSSDLAELDIPIVAPLEVNGQQLHRHGTFRFSVSTCMGGRAPELDDPDLLRQLGRLIGRIHSYGAREPFRHRPELDIDSFGVESVTFLQNGDWLPYELREVYRGVTDLLLDGVESAFARVANRETIRLHGDFHPGNVLVQGSRLHIVDLDDARSGPAVQDLWMFLSGDRSEQTPQLDALLSGYAEFYRFDSREISLIEALRTLRIMHYAAWLARRWDDPAFKAAFPWFDTHRYWDEHILALREQAAALSEPPLEWH